MKKQLCAAAIFALLCSPALAQVEFVSPNGKTAPGAVTMCVNALGKAVPADQSGACPQQLGISGAAISATNPMPVGNSQVSATSATIANAASVTGAIDLGTGRLARIVIPAAWTTANLTFQTSYDGTNYADLYDASGTEYTVQVGGVSRAILLPIADWLGVRYLKIRSGTSGSPVAQGGSRTLNLAVVN